MSKVENRGNELWNRPSDSSGEILAGFWWRWLSMFLQRLEAAQKQEAKELGMKEF